MTSHDEPSAARFNLLLPEVICLESQIQSSWSNSEYGWTWDLNCPKKSNILKDWTKSQQGTFDLEICCFAVFGFCCIWMHVVWHSKSQTTGSIWETCPVCGACRTNIVVWVVGLEIHCRSRCSQEEIDEMFELINIDGECTGLWKPQSFHAFVVLHFFESKRMS